MRRVERRHVDRIRNRIDRRLRQFRRPRLEIARDRGAHGDHGIGQRERAPLASEVGAHVRNQRPRRDAAPRRRAAGCTWSSSTPNSPGTARAAWGRRSDRTSSRPASSRAPSRPTACPSPGPRARRAPSSSRAGRGRRRTRRRRRRRVRYVVRRAQSCSFLTMLRTNGICGART